jgi:hypothetical protein
LLTGASNNGTSTTYSYDSKGERILKKNEYYLKDYAGREYATYNNTTGELESVNILSEVFEDDFHLL